MFLCGLALLALATGGCSAAEGSRDLETSAQARTNTTGEATSSIARITARAFAKWRQSLEWAVKHHRPLPRTDGCPEVLARIRAEARRQHASVEVSCVHTITPLRRITTLKHR